MTGTSSLGCGCGKFTGCEGLPNERFNTPCINYEGEYAYGMSVEMELYSAVVTTLLTDKYYELSEETVERMSHLISEVDPEFVAKLAIYARTQMNLRSVPLFLLVELSKVHSGDSLVSSALDKCILRADEIADTLACWQWRNSRRGPKKLSKVPNQIMVALRNAFNRFDEYQFAKYNHRSGKVSLKDALFLSHPKAKDENQQRLFDAIAMDSLATPYTWETQLSEHGKLEFSSLENRLESLKALWEELIDSGRVGYMALLRNLKSILMSGVDCEHIEKVCTRISSPHEIRTSRQLPFRFLSAYMEIDAYLGQITANRLIPKEPKLPYCGTIQHKVTTENSNLLKLQAIIDAMLSSSEENCKAARSFNSVKCQYSIKVSKERAEFEEKKKRVDLVLVALENAAEAASSNIPPFNGRTLVACDSSGSMKVKLSGRSKLELYDVGFVIASMLRTVCTDVTTGMFATFWQTIDLPEGNILANVKSIRKRRGEVGYSTNGHLVVEWANRQKQMYDSIILFTDCQLWNDGNDGKTLQAEWQLYKELFPNAKLYICDLAGYGTTTVSLVENDVFYVAGWSEKILNLINASSDIDNVLSAIKDIEI